ncbi:PilN domain-containing protein [Marinobacterium lutimaris]|uniref:General secretion pathway protein L n=1 Tax=Marinobacterium lutimaris TaxID=568106 RepID=A0A1H5X0E5_9GAMM|nr:PilN domain-containing protein [Marinobacterium lutimaris]SEG04850.1 general secretion pathway protein L [Marinobacterium lutimaris]
MNSDSIKQVGHWKQALFVRLSRFWEWWSGELLELVPPRWRARSERAPKLLHVSAGAFKLPDGHEIPWVKATTDPMLATWRTLHAGKGNIWVTLDDQLLLIKRISLPIAASERLQAVLGFELDRHTPFSQGQASYGYRVLAKNRETQRIEVELFVLPDAVRSQIVSVLSECGLEPVAMLAVSAANDHQNWRTLNLLPEAAAVESPGRRVLTSRPVLTVLVVSVLLALLFYQREQRLVSLQQEIGPRQASAEQAMNVRTELEALEAGSQYIFERKSVLPASLVILDELTRLIPDDTWISRFELQGNELRIQGESGNTSQLIGLLEQAPVFTQVSFTSPVTINPRSEKERFSLTALVVGEGGS